MTSITIDTPTEKILRAIAREQSRPMASVVRILIYNAEKIFGANVAIATLPAPRGITRNPK